MPPELSYRFLPRRAALAGLLSLGACGPTRLAPLTGPSRGRVVVLRGLFNTFSTGMNFLTALLRQDGFDASVHNHLEWRDLTAVIQRADRDGTLVRPFALIGHSYGADDVILMANRLGQAGVTTDLLVTFDPTASEAVGPGVARVLNFYQDRDTVKRTLDPAPGFTGVLENRLVPGESHITIDKQQSLHFEVLALLRTLAAERVAQPAAPLPPPPLPPSAVTARR